MLELGRSLEGFGGASSIYAGDSVGALGDEKISEIAKVVETELSMRPESMLPFTSEELIISIKEGRAACALDTEGNLAAFAQYWPYTVDETGDGFMREQTIFELGSWLRIGPRVEQDLGKRVFEACLKAGEEAHPDAGFIAITKRGNSRASGLVEFMGGEWIGRKKSKQIKSRFTDHPKMNIYRMGGVGKGKTRG